MPTVYIPTLLRTLTGGRASVEVEGGTVRQLIDNLERAWPGIRERLLDENKLRPNISVAVDGEVAPLGLVESVGPASEVHFLAAIKGGVPGPGPTSVYRMSGRSVGRRGQTR